MRPILPNSALSNLSIYVASLGRVLKRATSSQDSCSMQRGAVCSPALIVSSTSSKGIPLVESLHSSVQKWPFKNKNQVIVKKCLILEEESGQNSSSKLWNGLCFSLIKILKILKRGKQSPFPESFMVLSCLINNVIS